MSWEKAAYTRAGAALLSESVSGGALIITRALAATEASDSDLAEAVTLSGETHEVDILGIDTVENDGQTRPAGQHPDHSRADSLHLPSGGCIRQAGHRPGRNAAHGRAG